MIYIIGSGPAGVASAHALLKRNYEVTMLDTGIDLEPERKEVVTRMSHTPYRDWLNSDISTVKENMDPHAEGVNIKYLFGSDYSYRGMDEIQPVKLDHSKMVRTLARGGLSNVWGASVLPYAKSDLDNWPVEYESMEAAYKSVMDLIPHAGYEDDLKKILPLFSYPVNFRMSTQVCEFVNDIEAGKDKLIDNGFVFGSSRLAVKFNDEDSKNNGCAYCGMCLYGCPYNYIYSSGMTLDDLLINQKFTYKKDILVEKVEENSEEVRIIAKRLYSGEDVCFNGSKVFLGAGTVSSTRIMLNSLGAFNHPLQIKHSDHFQVPLLRYNYSNNFKKEEIHTLTQYFIELLDKDISPNLIHMQLYAYNDLFDKVMKKKFGFTEPAFRYLINQFLGRFLILKGYLHSDISSSIEAKLSKSGTLTLKGIPNNNANKALKKVRKKFVANRKYFKAYPLPVITKLSLPGIGNHSGGSFPMKERPEDFETDIHGRPTGFRNLHIIDSTVFPTIPSTTISLSIMANAYRIASHV